VGRQDQLNYSGFMSVQTHAAHPLIVGSVTNEKEAIFMFGYCEPLTSRDSALCFVEHYMEILNSLG